MSRERPAVVHVSSARTWRGGENQAAGLYGELARMGLEQVLVCARGSEIERVARERGYRVAAVPRRASIDPWFARGVARACRELGADVVHAHDPHAHTAAVLAHAIFRCRAPVVVHRRVDVPLRASGFTRWKYDHPAVRAIACSSGFIAELVRRAVRDPARVRVVHSGVDLSRFSGRREGVLRRELGVPDDVPLVGNVAALVDHKDYPTFVEAAAGVLAAGVDARFVAIGEGELRGDLEARIRARGLEGRMALAGYRADVPRILADLDVLLFTSKTEGLGGTTLEAMASRVPVVTTAVGGVPEIVQHGVSGLVAPIGDARALAAHVVAVLRDPALRARLVEGGVRRAAEFTSARTAEKMLALYREVLAR
jgi:glycosyltransferase involved in cell wall biosynthesis